MIDAKVVFVDTNWKAQTKSASEVDNHTAQEVLSLFLPECDDRVLALQTPFVKKALNNDSLPLAECDQLKVTQRFSLFERPPYFLTSLAKDQENLIFYKLKVQSTPEFPIPEFFMPIDPVKSKDLAHVEIIEEITQVFTLPFTDGKLFFGEESLSEKSFGQIAERAEHENITFQCTLTDKAISKIKFRTNLLKEIESTEKTYIGDLQKLIDFWKVECTNRKLFNESEIDQIFKDIPSIINCQQTFLSSLQATQVNFASICAPVFLDFAPFFKISAPYIAYYPSYVKIMGANAKKNKTFTQQMNQLQMVHCKDLASYLITPVQRMPRYILFLRELMKSTPSFHPDAPLLQVAYEKIEQVTRGIDQGTQNAEKQLELYRIQQLVGEFELLSASRVLIKSYDVQLIKTQRKRAGKFYLFNDLVLLTKVYNPEKEGVIHDSTINDFHYLLNMPATEAITVFSNSNVEVYFASAKDKIDFLLEHSKLLELPQNSFILENVSMMKVPPPISNHDVGTFGDSVVTLDPNGQLVMYNTIQGTHSTVSTPLPHVIQYALCVIGEKIFVSGGRQQSHFQGSGETYVGSPILQKWNKYKDSMTPRYGHTMIAWENKLVVFGGKDKDVSYNDVCILDTTLKGPKWTTFDEPNTAPSPRLEHSAILFGDNMVVYGGRHEKRAMNDLYFLDLNKLKWTKIATNGCPLAARANHKCILCGNEMIAIGGQIPSILPQSINLVTKEVKEIDFYGNIPPSLHSFGIVEADGGDFIIVGGQITEMSSPSNGLYLLKSPIRKVSHSGVKAKTLNTTALDLQKKEEKIETPIIESVSHVPVSTPEPEQKPTEEVQTLSKPKLPFDQKTMIFIAAGGAVVLILILIMIFK